MTRVTHTFTLAATAITALLIAAGSAGAASVGTFTGGDAGEGLDLEGTFIYAIDTANNGTGGAVGPDRQVGDALFKDNYASANLIPGTAPFWQGINDWGTIPSLGATTNDDNLENVLHDIGIPAGGRLSNSFEVVPGQTYKLQLILSENFYTTANREQDVVIYDGTYVDPIGTGRTVFDTVSNLNVNAVTGGWAGAPGSGVVVTSTFTALSNWVTISSHAPAVPTGGLDTVAIMNATTLEATPNPGVMRIIHNASELDTSYPVYAVNMSGDAVVRNVNGLNFQPTNALGGVPGLTFSGATLLNNWSAIPNLGATAGDNQLEAVMHDIWYSPSTDINIDATVGSGPFEVTLLFSENFFSAAGQRSFDVEIEGVLVVDELDVFAAAGGRSRVLALTYLVESSDGNIDINLLRGTSFADGNPIIAGLIIRSVPSPAALPAGLAMLGLVATRRRRR